MHKRIKYVVRRAKRILGTLRWNLSTPLGVVGNTKKTDRRLLIIYDLSSQPFSIGDILIFQEASLVLRENFGVDTIDFAFVYNPDNPTNGDQAFSSITESNVVYHLASILPIVQVNQYLGSLFVFNSL